MSYKYDIFVSYPYSHTTEAELVAEQFANFGIKVWLSAWDFVIGTSWEDSIKTALQESKYVVGLIGETPLSEDKWMQKEVDISLMIGKGKKYPMIRLALLPNSDTDNIPKKFSDIDIID